MDKETKKTSGIREYTDDKTGKFKEGNPGKPKGAKNKFTIDMLVKAIEAEEAEVEKQKGFGIPVFQQFVRMAYREPGVMIALMRKFVADKEKIEHSTDGPLEIYIKRVNAKD